MKTVIDIETLLLWAYRDELSKRQTSAAEGIWDQIEEYGQRGGIDHGESSAQRYAHFGLPDPDAELIGQAVTQIGDHVTDWPAKFDLIAAELSALITINDVRHPETSARRPKSGWGDAGTKAMRVWWGEAGARPLRDRPRDVLMVGSIKTSALVTMHAIQGTRPNWQEDPPQPSMVPATKGPNAMVIGECRGRNLYTAGSYCPLTWDPSPLSIVSGRAEYLAWHEGLCKLADTVHLAKFAPLRPKAPEMPWLEGAEIGSLVLSVLPTASNCVDRWGTLPLQPHRREIGSRL